MAKHINLRYKPEVSVLDQRKIKYLDLSLQRVVLNLRNSEMQAHNAEWENRPQCTVWKFSQILKP